MNEVEHRAILEKLEPDTLRHMIIDLTKTMDDHARLVRELDVAWNGKKGAARQASLCDMVAQIRHDVAVMVACGETLSWQKEPPNEQGYWWWWNEDGPPIPVNIFVSGHSNGRYFATIGQHGWNRAQWVEDMGGFWKRLPEPEIPDQV